jgi:hypothetical protein
MRERHLDARAGRQRTAHFRRPDRRYRATKAGLLNVV